MSLVKFFWHFCEMFENWTLTSFRKILFQCEVKFHSEKNEIINENKIFEGLKRAVVTKPNLGYPKNGLRKEPTLGM